MKKRSTTLLAILLPALAALILYWPTLRLPLIYDTLLHIRIAKGLDLATVWLPTTKFGFYRPLTFLPLLLIRGLFGSYPALLLHGLNVVQHALNAALLAWLAWRLWKNAWSSLAAGLLLALFPFAYQAVAVYGHNVHPTTATLMLLGLHCYLSGRRQRKASWWWLTAGFFVLSLLSHETAVLLGPFAALVQWNDEKKANFPRQISRLIREPWFLLTLAGGLYAIGYQWLPIQRLPQEISNDNSLWPKVLYLGQAAAAPFTWFAHTLPSIGAAPLVLGGLALTAGWTIWAARKRENRLPLLLGWGWWGLASALIAIPLLTDYLLHGPRLLYLGGVGLALAWAALLEPLRRGRLGAWPWLLVLALMLAQNWSFVSGQLALYQELTEPITVAQDAMQNRPADEGILFVNLPTWIAPARNTYPVGSEHVAMLGSYLFLEEIVTQNLGGSRPAKAIQLPEAETDPGYPYHLFGETDLNLGVDADWTPAGSQVLVTRYTELGTQTEHVGTLLPADPDEQPIAVLGPFELLSAEAASCRGTVTLDTRWNWSGDVALPPTVSLFVQALDNTGQVAAQVDGPPLNLRVDLVNPAAGWTIQDRRTLHLAVGASGNQLVLGAYDYASGERFAAVDAGGEALPDNAWRVDIEVCQP